MPGPPRGTPRPDPGRRSAFELTPTEQALWDLQQETGLGSRDLADALGMNRDNVFGMLARARDKVRAAEALKDFGRSSGKFETPEKAKNRGRSQRSRQDTWRPR